MANLNLILVDGQDVDMPSLRAFLAELQSDITDGIDAATLAAGLSVVYETRAELDADLAHDADTIALVWGDPNDANNDFYTKVGASGSGSWTLTTILNDTLENLAQPAIQRAQNAIPFNTWLELDGATQMQDGDRASVLITDEGTHTDPVTTQSVPNSGTYQFRSATPGWERIADLSSGAEGSSGGASNATYAGSAQMHLENGESVAAMTEFRVTNGSALAGSGASAMFSGATSVIIFAEIPERVYEGLNKKEVALFQANPATGIYAFMTPIGNINSPNVVPEFRFGVKDNGGAAWNAELDDAAVPAALKQCAFFARTDGSTLTLSVLDLETDTWYDGAGVAQPGGFAALDTLGDLSIGGIGQWPFQDDRDAKSNNVEDWRGSLSNFIIADRELSKADVEAIAAGSDPETIVGSGDLRFWLPMTVDGKVSTDFTSNLPALLDADVQANGPIEAGPTLVKQGTESVKFKALPWPCLIGREHGDDGAFSEFTLEVAGLNGDLEIQIVGKSGRIWRDWEAQQVSVSSGEVTFRLAFPCPITERVQVLARFASNRDVVAATHSNIQVGVGVSLWGQSELDDFTLGELNTAGGLATNPAIEPEGSTETITWVDYDGIVRYAQAVPGAVGSPAINIANYIRRRTGEPVFLFAHILNGSSNADLMDDNHATAVRDWNTEIPRISGFMFNRNEKGEIPVAGHVKMWEAADNVIPYMSRFGPAWYQGRHGANPGTFSIDHSLYDGTFSSKAVSVEMPANRFVHTNDAQVADERTDDVDEIRQRESQRNGGHSYGYAVGPECDVHTMENQSATSIGGTHPGPNDWDGAILGSFAVAEAICMAIGKGSYPGAVFFETIEPGAAANEVIVTLGSPREFPGEGLVNPDQGYSLDSVRAQVGAGLNLSTLKSSGNPKWAFEAKIDNAGSFSILNITAGEIISPRQVKLTLSANYVLGETAIRHKPGAPGAYGADNNSPPVTQDIWLASALRVGASLPYETLSPRPEPGFLVAGSKQELVLSA